MFFKSKPPEPAKEDSRIQDLKIITQMNQDLATTLDLNETLWVQPAVSTWPSRQRGELCSRRVRAGDAVDGGIQCAAAWDWSGHWG